MSITFDSEFAPSPEDASAETLSREEKQQLARDEKEIAKKYIGVFPLFMVFWWAANLTVWFATLPLYFAGFIPLWAVGVLGFLGVTLSYLPSHEAQHGNFGQRGSKWRWLNELIGYTSTLPMVAPYLVLRITHMKHHAHSNDPVKDPDYESVTNTNLQFVLKSLKGRQPGASNRYAAVIDQHPDKKEIFWAKMHTLLFNGIYLTFMVGMAWSGYAIEAFVFWFIPRTFGLMYISYFLSRMPHLPGKDIGRYRDTRAWKCLMGGQLGNIIALGMEYHIIHHLHPNIPLNYTPKAYWEMRDILVKRGCQIDGL